MYFLWKLKKKNTEKKVRIKSPLISSPIANLCFNVYSREGGNWKNLAH